MNENNLLDGFDLTTIIQRTIDGSYVVQKNGMPYHIPNEGSYANIWNEIKNYIEVNQIEVTVEKPYEPTKEEIEVQIQKRLTDAVQHVLDAKAQELNYDSCLSVCSYIDTGVARFDAEGKAFRAWRSAVWAKGYEILAQVQSGEREIPNEEDLLAELPELVIEYIE